MIENIHANQDVGDGVKQTQTFEATVAEVIAMARSNDDGLAGKVGEIDDQMTSADEQTRRVLHEKIRGPVLATVRQDPTLLARLSFASSLVNLPASPFFRAVTEALAEHEKLLTPEELLTVTATFRRIGAYNRMQKFADTLIEKLDDPEVPEALRLRSRLAYELHMAEYQKGDYQKSMSLAGMSADEAERAGDIPGKLYAQMNVSGLLLPALGRHEEGVALSEEVCRQAEELGLNATDSDARNRVLRIAMNTYFHRIRIVVENEGNAGDIKHLLAQLGENPVFQSCKDEEWVKKDIQIANDFIQRRP